MLYEWGCGECGHEEEHFEHAAEDKGTDTYLCSCGHTLGPLPSSGRGILWAEEGRSRRIPNLDTLDEKGNLVPHAPIRSWKDHQRAMQKAGVKEAGNRMGERGCWV